MLLKAKKKVFGGNSRASKHLVIAQFPFTAQSMLAAHVQLIVFETKTIFPSLRTISGAVNRAASRQVDFS